MLIPTWLGYTCLIGFSLSLAGVGLLLISYAGGFIINVFIPNLWVISKRFKVKNMSKEQFDAYVYALRHEWTATRINEGKQPSESEED